MADKILLADDRQTFRQRFRHELEAPGMFAVKEVDTCADLEALAANLRPAVVVVNLAMRGMHGAEQVRRLNQELPDAKIIAIARQDEAMFILELLGSGATGFLPLSAGVSEAVTSVQYALQGVRYISPICADRLYTLLLEKTAFFFTEPYQKLTRREREVFHLTAEGFSGPEIASRLTISPRTVELHRSNLMRKLGLNNQRDLIRYAVQSGSLSLYDKQEN